MKARVLLIFIFLFFRSMGGFTQSFYFTHYQVDDGLSNNAVLCMMQDKLGFMWFGTRDGLNRFDGLSYKVFRNDPSDSNTIGSNAIMCLSEDAHKKIWVGTEKGLYIFDQLTEKFTQFPKAGNGAIQALKVVDDKVYYITLYVLYCFDIRTKALKTYAFPNEVTAFTLLKNGALWLTSSAGQVARYDPTTDRFDRTYNVFTKSRNTVSQRIQSVCEAGAGNLLVGTSNEGLKLLNTKNGDYKDLLTFNADRTDINVMDILNTGKDAYWIATQSGIYIMDLKNNRYNYLSKKYEDPYSLSNNIVQSLFEDRQGGIWASTYFGGVNYFSTRQMIFKKYFPKKK